MKQGKKENEGEGEGGREGEGYNGTFGLKINDMVDINSYFTLKLGIFIKKL